MDTILHDVRYAFRLLLSQRLVTFLAILCLALGIGVNTTIFSVVDGIILRPLPFQDAEDLVVLEERQPRLGRSTFASYSNLRDWRERGTSFETMAGVAFRSLTITDGGEPERYSGGVISWDLFPMLGIQPALGRWFREDDDRPGAPNVVLLGDDLWRNRYGADPTIVGQTIRVNDQPHTVVGVMPPRFRFPENMRLWVPLTPLEHQSSRAARSIWVFARLREGVDVAMARAEMDGIAKRLEDEFPSENFGWGASTQPLRTEFVPEDVRLSIFTMMGAVTLVLLIACANVANLLLARATARHREMSIRAAIGAGRGRIIRQLITESVLLALLAVPLGILLAHIGNMLLDRAIPPDADIPYYIQWQIDGRVLVYTVAISAMTGLLFGLAPALQVVKANLLDALKAGSRGAGSGAHRHRLRNGLVIAEVALSLVLLVGAALFVRSFFNLQRASGGFDTAPLMTLRVYMPGDRYASPDTITQRIDDIIRRTESLPGVESATASNLIPVSDGGSMSAVVADGSPVAQGEESRVFYAGVTSHFFETLAVPVLRGRMFTDTESSQRADVAVINETMARQLWRDEDPVGRRFSLTDGSNSYSLTVLGVTPDIVNNEMDPELRPTPSAYLPYSYMATRNTGVVIRTAGEPAQITTAVRQAIRESDPTLPVFDVETMEGLRQRGFWQFLLFGRIFSTFGLVALVLAMIGVYGVLSYAVSQRAQEIGLRMALGARRADVILLVVAQGLKLAAIGIGIGFIGAQAVKYVIRSLLYNVGSLDLISFVLVPLSLMGVGALASYLPARRASSVDPIVALREE